MTTETHRLALAPGGERAHDVAIPRPTAMLGMFVSVMSTAQGFILNPGAEATVCSVVQ